MILHIYSAEPEYRFYCDYNDIDTSKYRFCKTIITNYIRVCDLIEAIESKTIDYEFEEYDLIELAPGSEELNDNHIGDNIGKEKDMNFLIVYGLGVKQVALDGRDLAYKRLQSVF